MIIHETQEINSGLLFHGLRFKRASKLTESRLKWVVTYTRNVLERHTERARRVKTHYTKQVFENLRSKHKKAS